MLAFVLVVWLSVLARRAYMRADRATDDASFRFRQRKRGRDVELAAAEAAGDDEAFAVARVREDGELLFRAIQAAWSRNDIERLNGFVAPELMKEWALRLKDFDRKGWRNKVDVKSVEAAYVGLVNREDDKDDRVVVRIAAHVRDIVVNRSGGIVTRTDSGGAQEVQLREWWTLGKRNGKWILLSIEQREEGEHHMESELVAAPEHDSRIADEAVTELATADKVAAGFTVRDVADLDFDGSARDAALDLALADGRFAPDVLEAAARRAVAAWVEAIDGEDAALAEVATPDAVARAAAARGRAHARRGARRARRGDADHRARRGVRARADDDRGRRARASLRREPRHGRGRLRVEGRRGRVHRALDAGPERARRRALADRGDPCRRAIHCQLTRR